jgi:hypothetical protein
VAVGATVEAVEGVRGTEGGGVSAEFTSGRENGRGRPRGYCDWRPHRKTRELIEKVEAVLIEYEDHLPLTVRQVFYRLVGSYGYDKTERAYERLCEHLVRARRARMIPFSALRDDRTTGLWTPYHASEEDFWDEVVEKARGFRLDRQEGQRFRVELWCEAAGMVPQLHQAVADYSVVVRSNGGFASLPAVRGIVARVCERNHPTVLLHVGDFDPSGESIFEAMAEDAAAFLEEDRIIGTQRIIAERVALTAEQVDEYDLPTAPPKKSDSRSKSWKGETCQLEALPPDALAELARDAVEWHLDLERLDDRIHEEESVRTSLLRALPAAGGTS